MKKVMSVVLLICLCLTLASCSEKLNERQKEIKATYENLIDEKSAEYDAKIEELSDLKKEIENMSFLEDMAEKVVDAGILTEADAATCTRDGLIEAVQNEIEFNEEVKQNYIDTMKDTMQQRMNEAK